MKINQPGQYLDHLMRQTRAHHMHLSSMADLKANMVLTIASVLVTLSAPHLAEKDLRLPATVLILYCLATILFAAYAVMPKFRPPHPNALRPDPNDPTFNILFFGDFTRLTYPEFEAAMEQVLNDPNQAYEVQVREVYLLGKFLAEKKYRFLRLAYGSFIMGLVSSGLILVFIYLF